MMRIDVSRAGRGARSSLSELLDARRRLRRQEICLEAALAELEDELHRWQQRTRAVEVATGAPPADMQRLCESLQRQADDAERDLWQLRVALRYAAQEVETQISHRDGGDRWRA